MDVNAFKNLNEQIDYLHKKYGKVATMALYDFASSRATSGFMRLNDSAYLYISVEDDNNLVLEERFYENKN